MKAVDTNVVLRLLVGDDAVQAAIAEREFAAPVLVTLTVLVETAWVLRARYGLSRVEIASVLHDLLDRSTVRTDAAKGLDWALDRFAVRGDIADLLHLVAARSASRFATFDRGVALAAGPDAPVPVETLG